jgi:hypothetical protein
MWPEKWAFYFMLADPQAAVAPPAVPKPGTPDYVPEANPHRPEGGPPTPKPASHSVGALPSPGTWLNP